MRVNSAQSCAPHTAHVLSLTGPPSPPYTHTHQSSSNKLGSLDPPSLGHSIHLEYSLLVSSHLSSANWLRCYLLSGDILASNGGCWLVTPQGSQSSWCHGICSVSSCYNGGRVGAAPPRVDCGPGGWGRLGPGSHLPGSQGPAPVGV